MNAEIVAFNGWSQAWAGMVFAILWQSTFLALVVALIAFALCRSSPALRFWLWQIVAIKLLLMPFWAMAVPLPFFSLEVHSTVVSGHSPMEVATVVVSRSEDSTFHSPVVPAGRVANQTGPYEHLRDLTWRSWLLMAWLAIVTAMICRLAWQRVRLAQLLRQADPTDQSLTHIVDEAAERLKLRCKVRAVLTQLDCSPFVCVVWRPVIVLPRGLTKLLDESQLRQVLLHELAHVQRCDLLWNWIPEITRIFYFFHPIVYYVNYRIRLERELSCDQLAMSASGATAADYADTLVKVVSHSFQPTALKAATSSVALTGEEPNRKRRLSNWEN